MTLIASTDAPYYGAPETDRREYLIGLRRRAAEHRHRANAFVAMAVLLENDTTIDRQFRAEVISTAQAMRDAARQRIDAATELMGQANLYEANAAAYHSTKEPA